MRYAKKTKTKIVTAYCLGIGDEMENLLIEEGAIRKISDTEYELFSQEAVKANSEHGQCAKKGDYFKVDTIDGKHFPYPNERTFFEENHRWIKDHEYVQIPKKLAIWQKGDELGEEIQYLLGNQKLILKTEDPDHYFNARLWGADLSAPEDSTIVFYDVIRDEEGQIMDIEFNFVVKDAFERDYEILQ